MRDASATSNCTLRTFRDDVIVEPVDLVFAALILEYVDVDVVIARTRSMLRAKGKLVTVLQLPGARSANVTPSSFASLQALGPVMRLVLPDDLLRAARDHGFIQLESRIADSAGGKQFQVQSFMASRTAGRP